MAPKITTMSVLACLLTLAMAVPAPQFSATVSVAPVPTPTDLFTEVTGDPAVPTDIPTDTDEPDLPTDTAIPTDVPTDIPTNTDLPPPGPTETFVPGQTAIRTTLVTVRPTLVNPADPISSTTVPDPAPTVGGGGGGGGATCGALQTQCSIYGETTCGFRATCQRFDAFGSPTPANFGKYFCVCQAGYRAEGVDPKDTTRQHRVTWVNANGDQEHRVFVAPGVSCGQLCDEGLADPRDCSEVPVVNACR